MTVKDHGYYGFAYLGARITQAIVLVPIIGFVGNFLGLIAKSKHSPPSELVATIIITVISLLWVILSLTAYHDTHIPYLATCVVDIVLLIPFVVFAIILGQPLSITTCSDLPSDTSRVALPISSLAGQPVSYVVFTGAGQTTCYELMAVWGLIIALCCLFAMSSITAGFLFLGKRRGNSGGGGMGMGSPGGGPGGFPNDSQIEMAPGKGSFPPSPSMGGGPPGGSPMGSPAGGPPMSPADSFGGPPPRGGPPGGFDDSPRGSLDGPGYPLSPPPPSRRR